MVLFATNFPLLPTSADESTTAATIRRRLAVPAASPRQRFDPVPARIRRRDGSSSTALHQAMCERIAAARRNRAAYLSERSYGPCLLDNPAPALLGDARSLVSTKRSRVIVFQLSPGYLEKLRISEPKC